MALSSCVLTAGYTLDCKNSLGGIQAIYVSSYSASTVYTYDSTGQITGSTNPGSYFTVQLRNEAGEFNQKGNHNIDNGTNYWDMDCTFVLYKNQASIRNFLLTLSQSQLSAIVLDENGNYFQLFEQNGGDLISSTLSAGKTYSSLNGGVCKISGKEPTPSRQLTSTYFSTLSVT